MYYMSVTTQELVNPHVRRHLVTIPELATKTSINRFSQSKRWRETLEPELRVQMVEKGKTHFYIYEVVELESGLKVVPCYFYQTEDGVMAKCLRPSIKPILEIEQFEIKIPCEPAFDSPDFDTIPIEKFGKTFSEIHKKEGVYLKDFSGNNMLCE